MICYRILKKTWKQRNGLQKCKKRPESTYFYMDIYPECGLKQAFFTTYPPNIVHIVQKLKLFNQLGSCIFETVFEYIPRVILSMNDPSKLDAPIPSKQFFGLNISFEFSDKRNKIILIVLNKQNVHLFCSNQLNLSKFNRIEY